MGEVLFEAGANNDYSQSLQWYAERSRHAAESFEVEVARAIEAIAANPDWYPLCDDRHRFYLLKRFPFQIIYRNISEGQSLIIAIAHTSRRPGYWSGR